jgi:hypothetical protein
LATIPELGEPSAVGLSEGVISDARCGCFVIGEFFLEERHLEGVAMAGSGGVGGVDGDGVWG